jgi:glucose/arabinose dehydrogenase
MLAFGPDGYLYLGVGDGGGEQGDLDNNAQNLSLHLGKILRLDVNAPNALYAVPPDNPFVGVVGAAAEVWALGLRNPWRFSFDRLTGDLYIGDVGWGNWEEVNFVAAGSGGGANFGWPIFEGEARLREGSDAAFVPPIATFPHSVGCAVTGGYVYRGYQFPALRGVYLYGDYCGGQTWFAWRDGAGAWQVLPFKNTGRQISSFGEDGRGELYLVDYKGYILRLVPG